MTKLDSILRNRDITLPTKVRQVKAIIFTVVIYGCESWAINKTVSRRIDAFEMWCWRRLLRPHRLDCKMKPVISKGNQSWIFIERTDADIETPIFWPPDVKNWLFERDPDAGKDWRREEKGTTENEIVGWHYQLNAHEFEQAPAVVDGQGSLACYSPWGHKE